MTALASTIQGEAMRLSQAGFGARFVTYRNTPMLQVKPEDLPLLAVYILRERHSPHGSFNHAEPKFDTELTLGISGGVHVETDNQNDLQDLEASMSEVLDILLTNPKFVMLTEGYRSIERTAQFAKIGETTLYEIKLEMVTGYWTSYPPKVEDDFNTLHVTTQYPDAASADSGTPQLIREYELDQNS
jgi:hypothetical protein